MNFIHFKKIAISLMKHMIFNQKYKEVLVMNIKNKEVDVINF